MRRHNDFGFSRNATSRQQWVRDSSKFHHRSPCAPVCGVTIRRITPLLQPWQATGAPAPQ
jgi:hypothetical protein